MPAATRHATMLQACIITKTSSVRKHNATACIRSLSGMHPLNAHHSNMCIPCSRFGTAPDKMKLQSRTVSHSTSSQVLLHEPLAQYLLTCHQMALLQSDVSLWLAKQASMHHGLDAEACTVTTRPSWVMKHNATACRQERLFVFKCLQLTCNAVITVVAQQWCSLSN